MSRPATAAGPDPVIAASGRLFSYKRGVPVTVLDELRRLRAIEDAASTPRQRSAVHEATGPLLAAAIDAGWPKTTLADAAGITPDTVRRRERSTPTTRPGDSWGLAVESPPKLAADADPRWLTPKRALAYTGVTRNRLYEWRTLGLLPRARLNPSGHKWSITGATSSIRIRREPHRGC